MLGAQEGRGWLTALEKPGRRSRPLALAAAILVGACGGVQEQAPHATETGPRRPSILLVTLDTTRADAIGPEASGVETPSFDALAARGLRFRQAYATVPETLPSHASMMTGLYPAGHSVRENARYLSADHSVLAERLGRAGYRTAAFVSSFVLARRFGLARGFAVYDDELPAGAGGARRARDDRPRRSPTSSGSRGSRSLSGFTTSTRTRRTRPPSPSEASTRSIPTSARSQRWTSSWDAWCAPSSSGSEGPRAILVVGDHGEGLGDHGESQHGNLVYQATMRVPLLLVGPGVAPGVSDTPVSTRRVFHTILDWAGLGEADSLRGAAGRRSSSARP